MIFTENDLHSVVSPLRNKNPSVRDAYIISVLNPALASSFSSQNYYTAIRSRFIKQCALGRPRKDGCLLWKGALNRGGYGVFSIRIAKQKTFVLSAHRFALLGFVALFGKRHFPGKLNFVLHTCLNKNCINPRHLYLGDNAQNMRDCKEANRLPLTVWNKCYVIWLKRCWPSLKGKSDIEIITWANQHLKIYD